jgi:hypothetical protein
MNCKSTGLSMRGRSIFQLKVEAKPCASTQSGREGVLGSGKLPLDKSLKKLKFTIVIK